MGSNLLASFWHASQRSAKFGESLPDLAEFNFKINFKIFSMRPHWEFVGCHVTAYDYPTWKPPIGPTDCSCHITC
jgi:hypothetical protein